MNEFLAPNGNPSNLNPEQYKLVRTPAFINFFGDWENDPENSSKVVDENGEPLVVYHGYLVGYGAGKKFNQFKNLPAFFSKTKSFAYDYASTKSMDAGLDADIHVYACFLNIRKLFNSENKDNIKLAEEQLPENIEVSHGTAWFLTADLSKEEVIEQMQGIITIPTDDLSEYILASNVGDVISEKVASSQYEDKILLYKDEDWGYITDAKDFNLAVEYEIAQWINNDYEKTIKYKNKYLPTFILNTETYKFELNQDPLFLEYLSEVEKRKKYYFDNILNLLNDNRDRRIKVENEKGNTEYFYVRKINLKTYKTTTKNNWTMFENETLQKFLIDNNFGGWSALERGDKTYGVYNANNIKLADGTNTTFDGNNPDIRFNEGGDVNDENSLIVTRYILNRHPKKDDIFKGGKVDGYKVIQINKIKKHYGIIYEILLLDTKSNADGGFNRRIIGYTPETKKISDFSQSFLTSTKGKYYTIWSDSDVVKKMEDGGDVNFNVDRYREIEKEMFELSTQGKTDSLEYFKLIKERSILEKNKSQENMNNNSMETFAKGGKILVKEIKDGNGGVKKVHNDFEKFGRIDVKDKYFIEASNDVGLQNVVFNKESLLAKITASFNSLLEKYENFVINKDSKSITAYIENEIKTLEREGASLDVIEREREKIDNQSERDNVIRQIAQTQLDSLKQWVLYLRESDYPIAFRYLILKAVIGFNYDLKLNKLFDRTDETIRNITPFDAGSLAELYTLNSNYLLQDYVQLMNDNSKRVLDSKEIIDENANGKWIKFNGGSGTSDEDIEKNGKDLMKLVQNTYWCTKSRATSQLMGGDFYVYVSEIDNEVLPQIAIRMDGSKVGEVRGNVSSAQDLSAEMLPIAKKFLLKNIPNDSGKKWLDSIQYNERCVTMRKRLEREGFYQDFIFEYIELLSQKNKYRVDYGDNGNVTLMVEKFNQAKENLPNEFYQRGEIEFDANFLSPLTKYFIGSIWSYNLINLRNQNIDVSDLSNWNLKLVSQTLDCGDIITNLGNVEFVGEDLLLTSSVTNFGSIKYIGGRFNMSSAQIDSLGSVERIGGGITVNSSLKDLGNLKKIGYLEINSCDEQFTLGQLEEIDGNFTINVKDKNIDFGNLKSIGGNFDANKTIITDLKELESVGGNFDIAGSKIKIFPNLKTIGGDADFSNNFCASTQNIEYILGNVKFLNSRIMEFPKLTKVGGEIEFRGSYFKTFGSIKSIGGNVKLNDSKIEELGDLEEINGYASFEGTKVTTLNKLKKIVKFANFQGSDIEDLGDLESIGGNAYFNKTKIKSIGKLKYIGGFAQFDGNEQLEKQWVSN